MMALQSTLFRSDPKLEAAAVSDAAHIAPGARGAHVVKIQKALIQLDRAAIQADGIYGPATAAAVLAYKKKRAIINYRYQTQADNIVGRMTVAALDNELCAHALRIDPIVIIGRPMPRFNRRVVNAFRPALPATVPVSRANDPSTEAFFGLPMPPIPVVDYQAVVRGNPFVSQGALEAGLPPSVPPRKTYKVQVLVEPPLVGNDHFIELRIINSSADNGAATVFPDRITRSTIVTVTGVSQTRAGHAGQLQIQAMLDGSFSKGTSAGFSVCAHPASITATFAKDVFTDTAAGMWVVVGINSDSGRLEDLDEIEFSEIVEQLARNSPPFTVGSGIVNNSEYQKALGGHTPKGKRELPVDQHVEPRPRAGTAGMSEKLQLHIFTCHRCGATHVTIPKSGFNIKHEVFQAGPKWKHRVTKSGLAVGIKPREMPKLQKPRPGTTRKEMPAFKVEAGEATNCRSPDHELD
jgi:peptidoglycan hydrolase-like protein with peptidoglycan-binding domain